MQIHQVRKILTEIGISVPPGSSLILVGGCALSLLGSSRPTIDIDFIGDDLHPSEFHQKILQLAEVLKIQVEAVPMERFIPLPEGYESRIIRIGQFGNLDVFVADPYSIALSKLERGFDTDFDDLVFLLKHNFITLAQLEIINQKSFEKALEFDINTDEVLDHLDELRKRL